MLRRSSSLVLFALALSSFLPAQEFRGTITGRITDGQHAAVPNAAIHATETETGAKFQTVSNADGSYALPFLPPGPYSLSVEASGFKRHVNSNVRVATNEREQVEIFIAKNGGVKAVGKREDRTLGARRRVVCWSYRTCRRGISHGHGRIRATGEQLRWTGHFGGQEV